MAGLSDRLRGRRGARRHRCLRPPRRAAGRARAARRRRGLHRRPADPRAPPGRTSTRGRRWARASRSPRSRSRRWPQRRPPPPAPSGGAIASIVVLGLLCTALAFVIFNVLIAEAGPARASVITYLNPLVAVCLGVLVLASSRARARRGAAADARRLVALDRRRLPPGLLAPVRARRLVRTRATAAPQRARAEPSRPSPAGTPRATPPAGLEPATPGLEGRRSIQLSYGGHAASDHLGGSQHGRAASLRTNLGALDAEICKSSRRDRRRTRSRISPASSAASRRAPSAKPPRRPRPPTPRAAGG